ncbi:MAG: YitT family protein [Syntrophobacterales bacterium]|nr:YitT family protein [Syntrophobacterales bacterium]
MKSLSWQASWSFLKTAGWNLLLMAAGGILCGIAINGILIPRGFVSGGVVGFSILSHYLWPVLSVAAIYFLLNIPLFIAGWFFVNRRFFLYSIIGMIIFTTAVSLVQISVPVYDKLLAALLAGLIQGLGSGIILKSQGSAGGTDILSVILHNRFSIRLGTTILSFNSLILGAAAFLFSLEDALYTMLYLYVVTKIVDLVVTGLSQRKAVFIVTPCWEKVEARILAEIGRGITILHGQGAYSEREKRILYTVVTFQELSVLKNIVRQEDAEAFVVISDTAEVMGNRIGNQAHW